MKEKWNKFTSAVCDSSWKVKLSAGQSLRWLWGEDSFCMAAILRELYIFCWK